LEYFRGLHIASMKIKSLPRLLLEFQCKLQDRVSVIRANVTGDLWRMYEAGIAAGNGTEEENAHLWGFPDEEFPYQHLEDRSR
jgi:hypothetical protein